MPKQSIAVELEAINRDGEIQTVHDCGLTVHGFSVYVRLNRPGYRGGSTF